MHNERTELKYRGTRCLNCEHELDKSDKYCPACGQLNSTKKLAFDDFFNEFFAGIFAYDSRFRRTLRALLFQPGKISKDYIQGKRMRYANPFRFYLSASIIFFLIFGFTSSFGDFETVDPASTAFDSEIQELPKDSIRALGRDLTGEPVVDPPGPETAIDSFVTAQIEKDRASYKEVYVKAEDLDTMDLVNSSSVRFNIYSKFYKEKLITNAERAIDSLNYPHTTYNHWLYKKAVDWNLAKDNPSIFVNYFMSKLPFIIFFYLPVFAFFIWLLYIRRPFNYMEHLIFTFHAQTTFFVIFSFSILLDHIFETGIVTTAGTFIFIFYLYKALRKFYAQSRVKTIVKFMILNVIFFILAGIATVFSILASFAIY